MACEESICRKCFHSYVCEKFNENKYDNNEKCHFFNNHYVPTADVVEVVRCKDCAYCEEMQGVIGMCLYCHRWRMDVDGDVYCSYGERKA